LSINDFEVPFQKLRWVCDPASLGMESTAELEPATEPIGQQRAVAAVDFGATIPSEGYNVFVLGPVGSGRTTLTRQTLEAIAAEQPAPSDWCYAYNFHDPRSPVALQLDPGAGRQLADDVDELIEDITQAIEHVFDSDEYQDQRDELLSEFREERAREMQGFEKNAEEAGFTIGRSPGGLVVAPAPKGEVITPEQYEEMSEEEREELDKKREQLQDELVDLMQELRRREKQARKALRQLDRQTIQFATGHLIDELIQEYEKSEAVVKHFQHVKHDLVENVTRFRDGEEHTPSFPIPEAFIGAAHTPYDRYRINALIINEGLEGAPVVFEMNPTIDNLTGEIEYQTRMGALTTDFTMIKPGALHQANGGYLILEAEAVLRRPFAWEALKRCLKNQQVSIESIQDQMRLISTVSLEPESIPLNIKVVLIGSPLVYYLLYQYDDEFGKLFKVKADFNTTMDRSDETIQAYARFIATKCHEEDLPPFSAEAAAKVVEYGVRTASDQEKLTTKFVDVLDLVRESAYWADRNGNGELVQAEDVQNALEQFIWRSNRVEERLLELIEQGTLLIETEGEVTGQINGLHIAVLGDYTMGMPTRITARSSLGTAGVVNIEREAELSGPIHNKGVLILSGYLRQKYASDQPLSCAASISFEQSYSHVEGDSASCAELLVLLSSISGVPLRQDIAVTGSVDQHGSVQAIGEVTRKVEGFFAACKVKGLTGNQGVVVPAANVRNIMLREEVVEAVEAGQFHTWAVETLDEALEILTGVPAGEVDGEGNYPEGTVHYAVQDRLHQMARTLREYGRGGAKEANEES